VIVVDTVEIDLHPDYCYSNISENLEECYWDSVVAAVDHIGND
jgi:hypothetical protein